MVASHPGVGRAGAQAGRDLPESGDAPGIRGCKADPHHRKELKDYLGAPRYYPERQALEERVGVVNGLAWTSVGGELLEVEVNVVPGTGKVELTGNLGM